MSTFILKRRSYSIYDETDSLKKMKDSDLLAEGKKSNPGYGQVAQAAATGAVAGGSALAVAGGLKNALGGGGFSGAWKGIKKGGSIGALVGGTVAGVMAAHKRNKQSEDVNFYNKRLDYAQKQAKRREKIDWKNNMTLREGYSY